MFSNSYMVWKSYCWYQLNWCSMYMSRHSSVSKFLRKILIILTLSSYLSFPASKRSDFAFIINFQPRYSWKVFFIKKCIAPEHGYIFSKHSWNLVKKMILIIFRRITWNYLNNCLRICVFMYVCLLTYFL